MSNFLLYVLILALILIVIYDIKYIEPFDEQSMPQIFEKYYSKDDLCHRISKKKELNCYKPTSDNNKNIKNCICDNNINIFKKSFKELEKQILSDIRQNLCDQIYSLVSPHIKKLVDSITKIQVDIDRIVNSYMSRRDESTSGSEWSLTKVIYDEIVNELTLMNDDIRPLLKNIANNNYKDDICNAVGTVITQIGEKLDENFNTNIPYNTIKTACNDNICDGFTVGGQNKMDKIISDYNLKTKLTNSQLCKKFNKSLPLYCKKYNQNTIEMLSQLFKQLLNDLNPSLCDLVKLKLKELTTKYKKEFKSLQDHINSLKIISDHVNLELREMIMIQNKQKCKDVFEHWKTKDKELYDNDYKGWKNKYSEYINGGFNTKEEQAGQRWWCTKYGYVEQQILFKSPIVGPAVRQRIKQAPYPHDCNNWANKCKFDCTGETGSKKCKIDAIEDEENQVVQLLKVLARAHDEGEKIINIIKNPKKPCIDTLKKIDSEISNYIPTLEIDIDEQCNKLGFDYCSK